MKIYNKRANFNFDLEKERVEAGLSLLGMEAKSLRDGRGDISLAFIKSLNGELYLINANIPVQNAVDYNPTRPRKLLLHKSQITSLLTKIKTSKLAIVPVKMYNKRRLVKLELALGKPKRKFEKKEAIKKKDIELDMKRELRGEEINK